MKKWIYNHVNVLHAYVTIFGFDIYLTILSKQLVTSGYWVFGFVLGRKVIVKWWWSDKGMSDE